tara:strand:- start:6098 stop:6319 length:222 start_codon:yes stop_codon:yes gene_type:complete
MAEKKKVTPRQLTDSLRKKSCRTPFTIYLSKELLGDENHPLSKQDEHEFRLRDIFDHIIIEDDRTKSKSDASP